MTESEYKGLVLADYDRKLRASELSAELVSPSPGNLKAEAARVCERRFDRKDELLLESFFNRKDGAAGYRSAILNCNADLFRPVVKLLREREVNTQVRNLNLLAWLIDFKPRPYRFDISFKDESNTLVPEDEQQEDSIKTKVVEEPNVLANLDGIPLTDQEPNPDNGHQESTTETEKAEGRSARFDRRWFIAIGVIPIIMVITLIRKESNGCMYWDDNHYIATPCGIPRGEVPLIEFNRDKLENFKKLKRTDTLTRYSLGHLWFTRVGDSLEVFTMEGRHPLYKDKKLKELTDFAINFCHNRKNKIGGR